MVTTIRPATEHDLAPIARLTAAYRHRLATWSPVWWPAAAGADELHPLWLGHLLRSDGPVMRVAEDGGAVVACAVSMPQPGQWFVDDVAIVDDRRWADAGVDLLASVRERPALTCVPTADTAKAGAARRVGLASVSSYWIRPTDPGGATSMGSTAPTGAAPVGGGGSAVGGSSTVALGALPDGAEVPEPPPHTFGGRLDPRAEGALLLADQAGGIVVGSPSVTAPPVYDPGGTTCVVDRVTGTDRRPLVRAALEAAGRRGDVGICVVVAAADVELQRLLAAERFERTVDVHAWA